jgi:hypothetical protein
MRRCLPNVLFALAAVTLSVPAVAQEARSDCPPGAWFCEEVAPQAPTNAQESPDEDVAPPAPPEPPRPPRFATPPPRPYRHHRPPVVVYQPHAGPPAQVVIVSPGAAPPVPVTRVKVVHATEAAPAPVKPKRWHRRWGLNLRVEGAALGGQEHGAAEEAGMGGLGLSLRYRPVPAFAFDLGVDVLAGTDWNGFKRTEMPVSLSGMLFVNPKSRVQFYFIGGAHFSHAEVESNGYDPLLDREDEDAGTSAEYSYFGGQGGIGLEFRLSRLVALNVDMLGFVRSRTDDHGAPEFVDPATGRTTNTSGGGLFRGGLTFWW